MNPTVALAAWLVLLCTLLFLDPGRDSRMSGALWVPVIWLFIAASRLPSQWLSGGTVSVTAAAFEEGNPLDRTVLLILILLGLGTVFSRRIAWEEVIVRNRALIIFLSFALLSCVWSDFPFITFKRWVRDLGTYVMVVVILSEDYPAEAIGTVLRQLGYLFLPLSVVLIKYFPAYGRAYDSWTGAQSIQGAATTKNMLGATCLVCGVFFVWDLISRWPMRKQRRAKKLIAVDVCFLGMTLWLMSQAHSTTSEVCLGITSFMMMVGPIGFLRRRPRLLKAFAPLLLVLYVVLTFGFNMSGQMASAVGKDPTLTDRTAIWAFVLSMHTNPVIGTGYQSFWIGQRLEWFWHNAGLGHINEAHDGYLEIYLELGWVGLALMGVFLVSSYRKICRQLDTGSSIAFLGLAVWTALMFYNVTEAALEGGMLYYVFLMTAIRVSRNRGARLRPKEAAARPAPSTPLAAAQAQKVLSS
jgi:O-antigen ligase